MDKRTPVRCNTFQELESSVNPWCFSTVCKGLYSGQMFAIET